MGQIASPRSLRTAAACLAAVAILSSASCRPTALAGSPATEPAPRAAPTLRIEAVGQLAEVGGGIGSMWRLPNGDVVLGPISPGLVSLSVERLVDGGGAPVDLPYGPGVRFALLVIAFAGHDPTEQTWDSAVRIDDRPPWVDGNQPVYAISPRLDSSFTSVRLEGPVTLQPSRANPMGMMFTTPAYSSPVGLAILDAENHILSVIEVR